MRTPWKPVGDCKIQEAMEQAMAEALEDEQLDDGAIAVLDSQVIDLLSVFALKALIWVFQTVKA
jgi:hypothetical protein